MKIPQNVILSRTDGIGDMVLMLPMAGILKKYFPGIKIAVLGKPYTKALVEACSYADEFIDADEFFAHPVLVDHQNPQAFINVRTNKAVAKRAKKLRIPLRVGTKSRLYHWTTCNVLVKLRRRISDLHEAQLNIKLLEPFGIKKKFSTQELSGLYGLDRLQPLSSENTALLRSDKYNLVVHPKSQGSSREWPLSYFSDLINMLDERFNIFISGVEKERPFIKEITEKVSRPVTILVGKMPLEQFLPFIKAGDGLLANATGPLHLAAALGVDAFGLYPPAKPIHPARWAPLGPRVRVFVTDRPCIKCNNAPEGCACMRDISPATVKDALETAYAQKFALP